MTDRTDSRRDVRTKSTLLKVKSGVESWKEEMDFVHVADLRRDLQC